ncbi:MAG: hypothetical protein ACOCUS_01225 [Polyangiales bacterium]
MDWMTFSAKLIDALVWPLTVLVGVLLLRRPLGELLPEMRKVKYKDFEAEFGAQMDELRQESEQAGGGRPSTPAATDRTRRLHDLAAVAPNAAVLAAWRKVETAARALLDAEGYELDYAVATPYRMIESVLAGDELLEPRQIKMYRQLRRLRNKVAHADDFELSPGQARQYVDVALSLCEQLEDAGS